MKRVLMSAAVLGVFAVTAAAPVSAQVVGSPIRFGVMGGATVPLSDFKDVAKTGWNAGALVSIGLPLVPVSFRIDGQWNQLQGKAGTGSDLVGRTDWRVIDGTADVLYTFGPALPTKFYLIGGAGVYNIRAKDQPTDATASSTKFGLNGGAGVKFQLTGFATFIEARYHYVFSDSNDSVTGSSKLQMIPISVGFQF